jgi:hypothetical protein
MAASHCSSAATVRVEWSCIGSSLTAGASARGDGGSLAGLSSEGNRVGSGLPVSSGRSPWSGGINGGARSLSATPGESGCVGAAQINNSSSICSSDSPASGSGIGGSTLCVN